MLLTGQLTLGGNMRSEGTSCSQTEDQALGTSHVTRAMDKGPACPVLALAFCKYPQAAGPSVV